MHKQSDGLFKRIGNGRTCYSFVWFAFIHASFEHELKPEADQTVKEK